MSPQSNSHEIIPQYDTTPKQTEASLKRAARPALLDLDVEVLEPRIAPARVGFGEPGTPCCTTR